MRLRIRKVGTGRLRALALAALGAALLAGVSGGRAAAPPVVPPPLPTECAVEQSATCLETKPDVAIVSVDPRGATVGDTVTVTVTPQLPSCPTPASEEALAGLGRCGGTPIWGFSAGFVDNLKSGTVSVTQLGTCDGSTLSCNYRIDAVSLPTAPGTSDPLPAWVTFPLRLSVARYDGSREPGHRTVLEQFTVDAPVWVVRLPTTGSIQIVKETVPTSDPQSFAFTGLADFSLDTDPVTDLPDRRTFADLQPGGHTISETPTPGWQLVSITCNDQTGSTTTHLDTASATIDLAAGETVTCTFRNRKATAGLVVNSVRDLEDQVGSDDSCDTGATITRNGAEEPECTLRAAIEEAGHQSGAQTIRFAIEGDPVIELTSALPTVIGPVAIDGTSQGASDSCWPLPACVQISSTLGGPVLDVAGLDATIRGLRLVPTASTGIHVGVGRGHTIAGNSVSLNSADVSLAGVAGIDVVGAEDVTLADNFVTTRGAAIRLASGTGHTVTGNALHGGQLETGGRGVGLLVTGSTDITIGVGAGSPGAGSGNTVDEPVLVADSSSVTLRGNTSLDGILVESGSNVRIEGNRVTSGIVVGAGATGVVVGGATPTAGTGLGNHIVDDSGAAITLGGAGAMIAGNLVEGERGDNGCTLSQGIRVEGDGNRIGGLTTSAGNTIRGFDTGVLVQGSETLVAGNVLDGNDTGLDVGGKSASTPCTVDSHPPATGTTLSSNVVSNNGTGVRIQWNSSGTVLLGNRVGVNAAGTAAAPNGAGVSVGGPAVIGGPSAGACTAVCNVISGNAGFGILVAKDDFLGLNAVTIQGNLIGVASDGSTPLPNDFDGISLAGGRSVTVGGEGPGEGNVIAHNGMAGVAVSTQLIGPQNSYGHTIRGNRIHSNGLLGIDLGAAGVTPNDIGDEDAGGNDLQNFPEWREVRTIDGQVRITGRIPIHSTVQGTYLVDLYLNTHCDTSRYGEGEIPYATLPTTDFGEGFFSLDVPPGVLAGRFLTATATAPNGSTSEFSACLDAEASEAEFALTAPAAAGATRLEVAADGLVGKVVAIGEGATLETNYGTAAGSLILARPLRFAHAAGEPVVATDDTLFVSVDRAVVTRSSKLPDVAALNGRLRAIQGRSVACGEDVTLSLDGSTVTQKVLGTRFTRQSGNRCVFVAKTQNGIGRLELDLGKGTWNAQVVRRDLERLTNPVDVGLRIGDDAGVEPLRLRVTGSVWTYAR